MKKHIIFIMAMVLSCGLVFAQENPKKEKKKSKVGSFLRKVGETSTGINMSNELYITSENAWEDIEVELSGCYGNSQSGEVYMVITVKSGKNRHLSVSPKTAVNAKGKIYEVKDRFSSQIYKDVIKDILTEYNLEELAFINVPATLPSFEAVQIKIDKGTYTFHNVPIQWDITQPEE